MKKRKRKLSKNKYLPAAICSNRSLLAQLIKSAMGIIVCAALLCKPGEAFNTSIHDEYHLLNETSVRVSELPPKTVPFEEQRTTAKVHLSSLMSLKENGKSPEPNSSYQISSASPNETTPEEPYPLDDLLAVESGNRLLSIGKPAPTTATSPPYANNNLTGNAINIRQLTGFQQTRPPMNESQLAKLYRSPPFPFFVRRPLGGDNRPHLVRLVPVGPIESSGRHIAGTKLAENQPASQSSGPWQSIYLPVNRNFNRPVEVFSSSPGVRQLETEDIAPLKVSPFRLPLAGGRQNASAEEGDQRIETRPPHDGASFKQEAQTDRRREGGSATVSKFPSLVSPLAANAEDEFEHSISAGHYQRTNSTNLTWKQLLRQATESNIMESLMVTNRSIVSLLCEPNYMLVRFKFRQPFEGLVFTNHLERLNSCSFLGTGGQSYEMHIPLNECGTNQEIPRLFINNIHIQFHQTPTKLDTADEELKTIICSYPIRPRAPPPAELPAGLPERIVEATASAVNEPAKLIYYEPLLLISGLLLLSLTLLGLTTSAYLFSKRFRGASRSFTGGAFGSAGLRGGNNHIRPAVPPLIGMTDKRQARLGADERLRPNPEAPPKPRRMRPPAPRPVNQSGRKYADDQGVDSHQTASKGRMSSSAQTQPTPEGNRGNHTVTDNSDSLVDKNERNSVTTIEIPFSNKTKGSPPPTSSNSNSVIISMIPASPPAAQDQSGDAMSPASSAAVSAESKIDTNNAGKKPVETKGDRQRKSNLVEETQQAKDGRPKVPKSSNKSRTSKREEKPTRERSGSKSIEVQVDRPPFGSLRSTLTSPRQYKRLQRIAELFDEVLIKSQVERGDEEGSVLVYSRQLSPSKYRDRILGFVDEDERRLIGTMLYDDEVFRSLVVESTNKEIFARKLRDSPIYGHKLKPRTWDLLEEIFLDAEFDSRASKSRQEFEERLTAAATSGQADTQRESAHSKQPVNNEESSQPKTTGKRREMPQDKPQEPKGEEGSKTRRTRKQSTRESVLAEAEASHFTDDQSLGNQDSLESAGKDASSESDGLNESKRTQQSALAGEPPKSSKSTWSTTTIEGRDVVRVSQFNSSRSPGGATGTLINIDSVTSTSSKDFSTFTRSSIEHTRYSPTADDSLPYLDGDRAAPSYEYAQRSPKMSPKRSNPASLQANRKRAVSTRKLSTTTDDNDDDDDRDKKTARR